MMIEVYNIGIIRSFCEATYTKKFWKHLGNRLAI